MAYSGYNWGTSSASTIFPIECEPVRFLSWSDLFHPKPVLPRALREGWHECLAILRKFNPGLLRGIRRGVMRIDRPAEKIPEEDDSWTI